jgi:hypothetical protein
MASKFNSFSKIQTEILKTIILEKTKGDVGAKGNNG